eukprot:g3917.t1
MRLSTAVLILTLCSFAFQSANWTAASDVGECAKTNFHTLFTIDKCISSKWTKPDKHILTTKCISSKTKTKNNDDQVKTKTKVHETSRETTQLSRSRDATQETVESVYFPGTELPINVEKALASIFSQHDSQWSNCPNCVDGSGGNPQEHLRGSIRNFENQDHESREQVGSLRTENQVQQDWVAIQRKEETSSGHVKIDKGVNTDRGCKQEQRNSVHWTDHVSIYATGVMLRTQLESCLQRKSVLLFLFVLLVLILVSSALLFVYGASDICQAILLSIMKLNPALQTSSNHGLNKTSGGNEDVKNERSQLPRTKNRVCKMKPRDTTSVKSSSSKKKSKSGINQKSPSEFNGRSNSKSNKNKTKNLGANNKTQTTKAKVKQEQQENDDNNSWKEVVTKNRSAKNRPPSREEQDIFPSEQKTDISSTGDIPSSPSTVQEPQSGEFSESCVSEEFTRVHREETGQLDLPRLDKNGVQEAQQRETASSELITVSNTELNLTMSSSGAFSDDSVSPPPSSSVMQFTGTLETPTTELSLEQKTSMPRQQSPFAAANPVFLQTLSSASESPSSTAFMPSALSPVFDRNHPNGFNSVQNEALTFQSRISCLLRNLRSKPFSKNTVSQCHSPMETRRLLLEDFQYRNGPPQRLNSGGFGLLENRSTLSLSGNLNNRLGGSGQLPHFISESYLSTHQQSGGVIQSRRGSNGLNRQMSCGLLPASYPPATGAPRLGQRTGSLPSSGARYPLSSQTNRATMTGHPLTRDCSWFSSNPSIWSVDLSVDSEFVNSSISANRFNSQLANGNGEIKCFNTTESFQQNIDLKGCLPDQLLSDTNMTG